MFKNIIVIVLLISVCTAFPTLRYIKLFGNILASHSVRNLGLRVTAPAGGNRIILKYPQVNKCSHKFLQNFYSFPCILQSQLQERFTIQGIKTVQNIPDSKMEIIDGGIGKDKITIAMTLPPNRDVNTEFYFYGDAVSSRNHILYFHYITLH